MFSGLKTESTPVKMRLSEIPPTGEENRSYVQKVWKQEKMQSFKDFSRWYNKDVVPSFGTIKKMVEFYPKGFDMLKLGCTLPNLADVCLNHSTSLQIDCWNRC